MAVIDAPVSGGGDAAEEGRLLVMTGGDPAVVDRCRPVFGTYADPIVHLGPLGSGAVTKAINNMLLAANVTMALDVFDLADELGLDKAGVAEALTNGTGSTKAIGIVAQAGFSWEFMLKYSSPYFSKDLEVMRGIAGTVGGARCPARSRSWPPASPSASERSPARPRRSGRVSPRRDRRTGPARRPRRENLDT